MHNIFDVIMRRTHNIMIEIGLTYTQEVIIKNEMTAKNVGSGELAVLATPIMIALMENSAMMAVSQHILDTETTVGGRIDVMHLKPSKIGETIKVTATLIEIEGKKLTYNVIAQVDEFIVGKGSHVRFIVHKERFMSF